jgi:hypothetical protein
MGVTPNGQSYPAPSGRRVSAAGKASGLSEMLGGDIIHE